MKRFATALMMTVFVATAGCFGGGDDGDGTTSPTDTSGTTTTTGTSPIVLSTTVEILNFTAGANVSQPIEVQWRVSLLPPGQTRTSTHTAVHFAAHSVPDANLTSPADYGNNSGLRENVQVPGDFNTSFTVSAQGKIYARAHAIVDNQSAWTDEIEITVTVGLGTIYEVSIASIAPVNDFVPSPQNVKVGDGVKWTNNDPAELTHTATSDAGAPAAFDTGDVGAGGTSAVIQFTVAGTYNYHCTYHASMTGQIVVT